MLNSLGYYKKPKTELVSSVSENKTPEPAAPAPIKAAPAPSGERLPGYTATGEKKVKCPTCGGYYSPTYLKNKHLKNCQQRHDQKLKKTCQICGQKVSSDQYATHTDICKTLKAKRSDEAPA